MANQIPPASEVARRLRLLSHAGIRCLSDRTRVPFTTLWKIRSGETSDPRIETVRAIWPELIGSEGAPAVPDVAAALVASKEVA